MKGWRLSSLMLVGCLTGCGVINSDFFTPPKPPLAWNVLSRPEIVVDTGGNNVTLVVSNATLLPVKVTAGAPPKLSVRHSSRELTLNFSKKDLFKPKANLVIAIPANVQVLTIQGGGDVQATALPTSLKRLNFDGSETVQVQGALVPLQQLVLNHVQQARIGGIKSTGLLVSIRDSGPVTLTGDVGIRELQVTDSGRVAITWVHSKELLVQLTGQQQVFLAGIAGLLITNVKDHAQLKAQYLRANKAFVHTSQSAVADVAVLDSLNAYAVDQSNIYYYLQPRLVGRYYQGHGSILYMGEQPPPCLAPECAPMPNSLAG